MKEVGIQHCRFIPRQHSDEIAIMTELVLEHGTPNLFPPSALSTSTPSKRDNERDLAEISKGKFQPPNKLTKRGVRYTTFAN